MPEVFGKPDIRHKGERGLTAIRRSFLFSVFALLVGALSLFGAAPAYADVLVSNVGQSHSSSSNIAPGLIQAQKFTTGNNSQGYTLNSIELVFAAAVGSPSAVRAEVWSVATNGTPGVRLVSLNVPASIPAGNVAFTAPSNTVLDANRSYFMVFGPPVGGAGSSGLISSTASNTEDAGAASGWSIADEGYFHLQSTGWYSYQDSKHIRINGAARVPPGAPTSLPAAPTGLGVTEGDSKLDLSWTAPSGTVTGYDVHYTSAAVGSVADDAAASGANPATAWVAVNLTGERATFTNLILGYLTNGTAYRVRVRAKNAVGPGAWAHAKGTPVRGVVPATPPAAPASLDVLPNNRALTAHWAQSVDTVTGYDLHYTSAPESAVGNDEPASDGADRRPDGWRQGAMTSRRLLHDRFRRWRTGYSTGCGCGREPQQVKMCR